MKLSLFLRSHFSFFVAGLFVACAALNASPIARGDASPAAKGSTPSGARSVQLLQVDDGELKFLRGLNAASRVDAVSLGASGVSLQADNVSRRALARWVRAGGVVFLHTDAARVFGFRTTPARAATNRVAGQLFGRSAAALPLGAHPLLLSGIPTRASGGGSTPSTTLGVQSVFYQFAAGDDLVVLHPAATPLLRAVDAAAPANTPTYAAAIAPFGKGWAVFVPRLVEQHRGDGAVFVQNLMRFAQAASATRAMNARGGDDPPVGQPVAAPARNDANAISALPASLIEQMAQTAANGGDWEKSAIDWNQFLNDSQLSTDEEDENLYQAEREVHLVLTHQETVDFRAALEATIANAADAKPDEMINARFRASAFLLRARLELQRANLAAAASWLQLAGRIAPSAAEVLLWRGALAASQAQNQTLASPLRAQLLNDAERSWRLALSAELLTEPTLMESTQPAQTRTISGVLPATITGWIASASRATQLALAEPPLVQVLSASGRLILIRHFVNDPTLGLALPAANVLSRTNAWLGWNAEIEEILIFPTERHYAAFTAVSRADARTMAFNPLAQRGNVSDHRIAMVSQNTTPIFLPGPPPRFVRLGAAVPAIVGRLHAQVLINALAEGGAPVPNWMQLGLMSLSNSSVVGSVAGNTSGDSSLPIGTFANLSPQQFWNVSSGSDSDGLIENQARRLMQFFYGRFGAGAVAETLQRLGAGQSADAALRATTGLSQAQFFLAWQRAEQGR